MHNYTCSMYMYMLGIAVVRTYILHVYGFDSSRILFERDEIFPNAGNSAGCLEYGRGRMYLSLSLYIYIYIYISNNNDNNS